VESSSEGRGREARRMNLPNCDLRAQCVNVAFKSVVHQPRRFGRSARSRRHARQNVTILPRIDLFGVAIGSRVEDNSSTPTTAGFIVTRPIAPTSLRVPGLTPQRGGSAPSSHIHATPNAVSTDDSRGVHIKRRCSRPARPRLLGRANGARDASTSATPAAGSARAASLRR
jgi:hypothetical protein